MVAAAHSAPLVPNFSRTRICSIRRRAKWSQSTFGILLNVGKPMVVAWEKGSKKPRGPAARLLDMLDRKGIEALF